MTKNERWKFTGESQKNLDDLSDAYSTKYRKDDVKALYSSVNGKLSEREAKAERERERIEKEVNDIQIRHRKQTSIKLQREQNEAERKRIKELKREVRQMKYSGVKSAVDNVDKVGRKTIKVGKALWKIAKQIDKEIDSRRSPPPKKRSTKRKTTKGKPKKRKTTKGKSRKRKTSGKKKSSKSKYVIINGKAYPRG